MRLRQREDMSGVSVVRVPLYPSHDASARGRIANYASFALSAATIGTASLRHPDLVFAYHPPATVGLPALLWKGLRSVPMVYHIADMWPDSVIDSGMIRSVRLRDTASRVISRWCSLLYRSASAITVLSPGFKSLLIERGVEEEKIHVIYNWADEAAFAPGQRDPALAQQLGFAGRFNILYAGNLGTFQGLDKAIVAMSRLRHLENLQLVFVGTGIAEAELKRLASSLGLQNVLFIGWRPYSQMSAISNLADVMFVSLSDLPFFTATIPHKTQLSLAIGKPVIIAGRGDGPDLVLRAGAGIACDPGDDVALAAAFERMYSSNTADLDRMGLDGRRYYEEELSLSKGCQRFEQIFSSVSRASGSAK
jgi:glycosyltransferase involved in cell wall biosynthesis